jgi:translation initiation factor IF-1
MLLINNYNRDEDNAKYVQACLEQRKRMNTVRVLETDVLTVKDIAEHTADYEDYLEDVDFIRHGGA